MNRRFGVEIEAYNVPMGTLANALRAAGFQAQTTGYGVAATPYWKVSRDGSLYGVDAFEMVSPVLQGEAGLESLGHAMRVAKVEGAKVNRTCGLHVHIEANGYELKQFKMLVKTYANNEDIFDALMPVSRRGQNNQYTRSLMGLTVDMTPERRVETVKAFFARIDACTSIREVLNVIGDRYRKLNLHAYAEHGTVEFRQHSGTLDVEKVTNWVRLTQAIVAYSATARAVRPWGVNQMSMKERLRILLRMLGVPELYTFYAARISELQGGATE